MRTGGTCNAREDQLITWRMARAAVRSEVAPKHASEWQGAKSHGACPSTSSVGAGGWLRGRRHLMKKIEGKELLCYHWNAAEKQRWRSAVAIRSNLALGHNAGRRLPSECKCINWSLYLKRADEWGGQGACAPLSDRGRARSCLEEPHEAKAGLSQGTRKARHGGRTSQALTETSTTSVCVIEKSCSRDRFFQQL